MEYPRVKPRSTTTSETQGVYADLDDLVRLQFKARGFSFLPRQPVHSILAGRRNSRVRGRGLNFEELRGYLPGDDIRNIDWKVTARTGEPHVRVYTEEKDRPALLLIDQRLSMFFGTRRSMKSVVAAEVAALSAWRILASGDRVGAMVFNDDEIIEFKPHRSENRVMQVLRATVELNRKLGTTDPGSGQPRQATNPEKLNKVLQAAARIATHDYLVILISDCHGGDEQSAQLITRMCQHNDLIIAFIYDSFEAKMPNVGRAVVSEGDFQLEINTADSGLRKQFQEQFDTRLDNARNFSRKRSVPLLPIQTGQDAALQIRNLLGQASQSRSL